TRSLFEPDLAAVQLDEALRHREAEPRPRRAGGAPEPVERAATLLGGQARAFVDDVELSVAGGDEDPAPCRACVDRVRQEVVEHLLDAGATGADDGALPLGFEPEAPLGCERVPELDAFRDYVVEVDGSGRWRGDVHTSKREELVDEPRETVSLDERPLGLAVLEPQAKRGQRRAELVRRVGDELLLRCDQLRQLRRRAIPFRREA